MTTDEIRQKYLDFFVGKGHKIIPVAPLVPENDPTTLFTSSGMQQLIPYLKGEPHPQGKRLTDSQPSLRTQDIEEVGDTSHTTFFEMLGNWSLGGYFKKEQLPWFLEFLTRELGLSKDKLFVSVFEGVKEVPKDDESAGIWKSLGIPDERIFFYGVEKNWWSRSGAPDQMPKGEIGGPDSEVFYDFGEELGLHEKSVFAKEKCHPNCQCGRFLEIGNSVFIQYEKKADGTLSELPQKNVDFGGGLERLAAAANNDPDVFKIDLFIPIIRIIEQISGKSYESPESKKPMRIIADHLRAAIFLIKSGVEPSNKSQGYVLRRLLRRAAVKLRQVSDLPTTEQQFLPIVQAIIDSYGKTNYFFQVETVEIKKKIEGEFFRFTKSLDEGLKIIQKTKEIDGKFAFDLYQTHGFPLELTEEIALEKNQRIDKNVFEEEFKKHQELSRTASAGMFKGGLADHSEEVTKLHTATHLLHAALRQVLGEHVQQKGSNITAERLRFDFSQPQKLTEEETRKIEGLVNQKITENLPVKMEMMDLKEAAKSGALGFFAQKYGEKVKVYTIGPSASSGRPFSVEICGGPHVDFTGRLGSFKIIKEEAAALGVRRIYATITS